MALASAIVAATVIPAGAFCMPYPDDASTRYSENNVAQAVCLENELALRTDDRARQILMQMELQAMQRELQRQRLQMMAPPLPAFEP